ncbi:ABC transporter substrate-binding protein [Nocardioides phosphati]|uniref:ABC transporter substrate-binding protein n=1 Tax=Nocardioides phosphati TaxID=1867775 RepID=A0ABQ2NFB5_9ACTN|nr:MCE family protein [Nocardioides phosphati]GGO93926.1 ABC transporter substrate-binding protein [Nocardioides phosphati]
MGRLFSAMRRHPLDTVGIVIFTALALLLTSLVAGTLAGRSGPSKEYEAVFHNASGLAPGDDVRISGVRVGKVKGVQLDGTDARIRFSLADGQKVYQGTTATVEFLNLLGQRYLHLEATSPRGDVLAPGSTIPVDHTRAGLDLTAVFNAFRPLFEMIKPGDVNQLADEIVQALQGQGGTIRHLVQQTAELTGRLVDRDEVIGSIIDNLTVVMGTMDQHRAEFRSLITELNTLTGVVARNRDTIGRTIDSVQGLVTQFAALLAVGNGDVIDSVEALARWSSSFATVAPRVARGLKDVEVLLKGYVKTLGIGSFLNTYVCKSDVKLAGGPPVDLSAASSQHSWRCP